MVYQTPDEIKERVEYGADDFFDNEPQPGDKYDSLLERLEKESRKAIESYKGDITFEKETKTQKFNAPESTVIQLEYPVHDVLKVEYQRYPDDNWEELDSQSYKFTDHNLILIRFPKQLLAHQGMVKGRQNPLTSNIRRYEWVDFATTVRVEYERGYEDIPENIVGVQITLINKKLRQLREEQNIAGLSVGDIDNLGKFDTLMTEDVQERLDETTSFRNAVFTT